MDQILLQKNGKTICWRNLTQEDEEEVERLMKEYCKTEPLTTALYSPELEESMVGEAKRILSKSLSIGAFDLEDKGKLCALNLVSVFDPVEDLSQTLEMANEYFTTGFSVIYRFGFETVKEFLKVVQEQKFIFHYFAVTTANYQRMGIATQLQKKLEAICQEQKCRYIIGVYSSEFTKRSSNNLSYKDITEIKYADYIDPLTKEMPFKDIQFHTSSKGMYFDVSQ